MSVTLIGGRKPKATVPWMVIVGLDNVVQRTVFVDQGRIIVEQESASPAIAGT